MKQIQNHSYSKFLFDSCCGFDLWFNIKIEDGLENQNEVQRYVTVS